MNNMTEELAPTLERIRTYWNRLDKMVSSNPNQVTKDSPSFLRWHKELG